MYAKEDILRKYPGAWLFLDNVFPEQRYNEDRRIEEANIVIQWHKDNGTEDTLESTYRGDFYKPVKGSPEESLYWGDFYTKNRRFQKV